MKKIIPIALLTAFMSGSLYAANFDIGVSGSDRGIDGFSLSIGNYYHAPVQEIMVIERSIPRDEMSVVYFLARQSHRSPQYVTDLRLRGISWWDISLRLGLDPRTLYVINSGRYSQPPYGNAYGYHNGKRHHKLRDSDIVELVNVRFLSRYHGISPDEVIDRRRRGEHYRNIDNDYRGRKSEHMQRNEYQRQNERQHERQNERGRDDRDRGDKRNSKEHNDR
ncbi:MAG TPA: hypothetical protein VFX68_02925 [Sulfuricurvum sp.]|nr:hypothetical protein [Sulfuricurvum sp.]